MIDSSTNECAVTITKQSVVLKRAHGCILRLPKSVGSGKIIRVHVQESVLPGMTYTFGNHQATINGVVLVHNLTPKNFTDILSTETCKKSKGNLTLGVNNGGMAGGYFELADISLNTWSIVGTVYSLGRSDIRVCGVLNQQ